MSKQSKADFKNGHSKKKKHKFYMAIGFIVGILVIVGLVSLLYLFLKKDQHRVLTMHEFNLRLEPSLDAEILGQTKKGELYPILEEVEADISNYGNIWYRVKLPNAESDTEIEEAYMLKSENNQSVLDYDQAEKIRKIDADELETLLDDDFKQSLKNFPESYRQGLIYLHVLYPQWNFIPMNTDISFAEVVEAEAQPEDKNLIQFEEGSAYFAPYSWMVKNLNVYDGSNWVPASAEGIAFYLDPRNFLSKEKIWQFLDLRYEGQKSSEGVERILVGNEYLSQQVDNIMLAAKEQGLLPEAVAARMLNEVGINGKVSISALGTVDPEQVPLVENSPSPGFLEKEEQIEQLESLEAEGNLSAEQAEVLRDLREDYSGYEEPEEKYYNFFNIGSYPDTSMVSGALVNGAKYARGDFEEEGTERYQKLKLPWTDPERAISGGAYFLANDYINQGQSTAYLQKFDLISGKFSHQYMQALFAAEHEADRLYISWIESGESWGELNFLIPVFKELPESTAPED